jgi:hypothetical protein
MRNFTWRLTPLLSLPSAGIPRQSLGLAFASRFTQIRYPAYVSKVRAIKVDCFGDHFSRANCFAPVQRPDRGPYRPSYHECR